MPLFYRHFGYALLVAAAVKRCLEELVDDSECESRFYEACRKYKYVGVVVGAGKSGQFHVPAEGGAYALMLVESHADTVAAAADADAGIVAALFDSFGTRVCEVGVVAALGAESAEVFTLDTLRKQIALYNAFEFISGMVAAYGDLLTGLQDRHDKYKINDECF